MIWHNAKPIKLIVEQYFEALNSHDSNQVVALYKDNAVHVTGERTLRGKEEIRAWYDSLFTNILPEADFSLVEFSGDTGTRQFSWTADSPAGRVINGNDSFGLSGGMIIYHYTFFSITTSE